MSEHFSGGSRGIGVPLDERNCEILCMPIGEDEMRSRHARAN